MFLTELPFLEKPTAQLCYQDVNPGLCSVSCSVTTEMYIFGISVMV